MKSCAPFAVSGTVAVILLSGAYTPIAHETVATSAPPCEATPPSVPTVPLPQAPANLRVVGGADALETETYEEAGSGPFVREESAAEAAAAGPHDYYVMLASRSDCVAAYSLRDPRQLATRANGGYTMKNDTPPAVTYDPANDSYPYAQDAAKVVIPSTGNNLPNQVRLPIPTHAPQSLFVTWDGWFGPEYDYRVHGIVNQKTWQFGSPFNEIHSEVRNRYAQGASDRPGSIARIDGRQYYANYSAGPNVTKSSTLEPQVGNFYVQPRRWTRWFAFFKARSDGWYEYSLWAADTQTDPVLLYDRLLLRPSPESLTASWESFWLEFNTSTSFDGRTRPPLVAYVRNIVMLKGINSVDSLLQRPVN